MKKIKTNVSNKGTEGLIIIGDVHGKVNRYWDIIKTHKGTSIQVGDFGFKPHTPLRDGLRKFAEWYKKFYME